MNLEELEPLTRKPGGLEPRNLEDMSIDELEHYIGELEGEINRVRQDIAAKQHHLSDAESAFKP